MHRSELVATFAFVSQTLFFSMGFFSCSSVESNTTTASFYQNVKETIMSEQNITQIDTATFGAGCFWCVEAIFQRVEGVLKVKSGYCGGHVMNPTYEQVCEKNTGHAEVIQIVFDNDKITFDELLEIFWKTHDPTTLNQQGNDIGPQYRSAVFYHNDEQKTKAIHYKEALNNSGAFPQPIVTTIEPYNNYFEAENYHQNYYNLNKNLNPYCTYVVQPKVEKFEKIFNSKLRKN
jgi:peptide-methionine (S)-S-oxide reductase